VCSPRAFINGLRLNAFRVVYGRGIRIDAGTVIVRFGRGTK
jgi:hypothetical protein